MSSEYAPPPRERFPAHTPPIGVPGVRMRTVLHVDDNAATRYLVGRMLRRAGYDVVEASTGAEALALAGSGPDLVLLDVRLPDASGFDVCRGLKAGPSTRHLPVLLLSATFTEGADKAHGLDGGADGYLTHPIEGPELAATVRALLRAGDAEAELRLLTEALPQIVWTARPDGAVEGTNAQWPSYTGLTAADAAGAGWERCVHPDERASTAAGWADAVVAGQAYEAECRLRRADGTYRWHLGRAVPMRDRDGRVAKWVGTWTDVDDARRAAEAVRAANAARAEATALGEATARAEQARAEAERARAAADVANLAKSQFLAMMSHELRTPLNAIGGYAQLLEAEIAGPLTADQRDYLVRMGKANRHLLALVNDLLNLTRLEAGQVPIEFARVSVSSVCETLEAILAPQVAAKGLTYSCPVRDPLLLVRADAERLLQVLVNLTANAVKFTDAGGTITLDAHSVSAPGDDGDVERSSELWDGGGSVEITVADTGRGIPADKLGAIFEPFVQVGRQLNRPTDGVGLGLAISRDLARKMGGDLTVESEAGRGSAFRLVLPRAADRRATPGPMLAIPTTVEPRASAPP